MLIATKKRKSGENKGRMGWRREVGWGKGMEGEGEGGCNFYLELSLVKDDLTADLRLVRNTMLKVGVKWV